MLYTIAFLICQAGSNYGPNTCGVTNLEYFFESRKDCEMVLRIVSAGFKEERLGEDVELVESKCLVWTMGSI